jgi:hypothetical protein
VPMGTDNNNGAEWIILRTRSHFLPFNRPIPSAIAMPMKQISTRVAILKPKMAAGKADPRIATGKAIKATAHKPIKTTKAAVNSQMAINIKLSGFFTLYLTSPAVHSRVNVQRCQYKKAFNM